jgi:hypothetical protein
MRIDKFESDTLKWWRQPPTLDPRPKRRLDRGMKPILLLLVRKVVRQIAFFFFSKRRKIIVASIIGKSIAPIKANP